MTTPKAILIIVFLAAAFAVREAKAEVGVGISPTKIVFEMEGGTAQTMALLVFNSGDSPLEITLVAEGDIAAVTSIPQTRALIDPEPTPHALPIKNGKNFDLTFSPPSSSQTKRYTGTISAIGSPSAGSQLGGSVGVAAQVELTVLPSARPFAFLRPIHLGIAGVVVLLLGLLLLLLRRTGLRLKLEKK